MKISNIHKPTSARMSKLGLALVSVSTFIAGYALTQDNITVGFIGLGIGIVGTFIINIA